MRLIEGSLLVVVDFRHDDQTDTSPDLHRDAQGKTDLMHAVMHVDFEAVVRLVDAGSDVNARSYAGLVVLDYTFYAQRYELQPKLSTQQRQICNTSSIKVLICAERMPLCCTQLD